MSTGSRIAGPLGLLMLAGLAGCSVMQGARDPVVKAPRACQDQAAQIYFEPDSAEITDEGRAVLQQAAAAASACVVDGVEVLGLADAVGAPEANLELSRKRAETVSAALAAAGLPAAEFKLAAAGQAGAVTASGEARPLRRRVDLLVHLSRRK